MEDSQLQRKFERMRAEPFAEVLALLRQPPVDGRVLDLGCGDGSLTARLHDHLAPCQTRGVSQAPLENAPQRQGLEFTLGDLREQLQPGQWDVIFSYGGLDEVEDQRGLVTQIVNSLRPGGQLAIARLLYPQVSPGPASEDCAPLLANLGLSEQKVGVRVFPYRLKNADEIAEWWRPTWERRAGKAGSASDPGQPCWLVLQRLIVWARKPELIA